MNLDSKFFEYHPGSLIGKELVKYKHRYIELILTNPSKGVKSLVDNFKFGSKSEFWDDFIFNQIFVPIFDRICELELDRAVNLYSSLDHLLFTTYIRRDEDPVRFRRAFWNVNSYGLQLANKFQSLTGEHSKSNSINNRKRSICFVFKGPFSLAHSEFLNEFLIGAKIFIKSVRISLLLIDDQISSLSEKGISHIDQKSLANESSTYAKMLAYRQYMDEQNFDHICWVACVQNLSLYMGMRCGSTQSYWSMKYHSIIMNTLDKYAGLGFGGGSFTFDDINWFRGRAFPRLMLPLTSAVKKSKQLQLLGIKDSDFIIGCFVRSEKLNNSDYWRLIQSVLESNNKVHFVLASQSLPGIANKFIKHKCFKNQFHHLGWVNTKEWCQYIDLYLDSFPRGSCLTILEAIKADVPIIMFDSSHNQESSALPYLASVSNGSDLPPGILSMENLEETKSYIDYLIKSNDKRSTLAQQQKKLLSLLEGKNVLFAKDYLNYFLDASLTMKEALKS